MKTAIIGTYPPRQCGIGTFTNNLLKAVVANKPDQKISSFADVIALNDQAGYDYPEEVRHQIRQNHQRDYIEAAKYINTHCTSCVLEHEFGIFGGDEGVFILPLIHRLDVPLIVTFHTVLKQPSYTQKAIVQEIGKRANRIIVMCEKAVQFLENIYNIPSEKITLIEHGVPDFEEVDHKEIKEKFNFQDKKVIITFGLLSRNKGIETVIQALPRVVEKHPNVLYLILGSTHPNVYRVSGEEYRDYLKRLVKSNKLENNVVFLNQFVSERYLYEYLKASDVYITPYLNEAQITSGTLSYAIGAGAAVVSTPYWHATELLAENRGRLFNFKDSEQLSEILIELFDHPDTLNELRKNAFEYGKKLRWPRVGKQYLTLIDYLVSNETIANNRTNLIIDPSILPPFNMAHIRRLTDDTGIIQHAKFGVPNLKEGYCLDDNGRALLFSLMAYRQKKDETVLNLIPIYLSYIHYMQNEDGTFRNFLSFNRQFLDEVGSEDSFGRAFWALGYMVKFAPNDAYHQISREIFGKSINHLDKLQHIRAIANSIIGLSYYLKENSGDEEIGKLLRKLTKKITGQFKQNATKDWDWFEDIMSYDNAILPLALYHSHELTGDEETLEVADRSTAFLEKITFREDYLSPVGNNGWFKKGGKLPLYDQQSIDVMAMVLLYFQAFQVKKDPKLIQKLFTSYMWFQGENQLRIPLYDFETKGCCDGLEETGVNRNQGAESTLAYWISHLTVLAAHEREYEYVK